jgi:trehalose 6-phosphate synthase
VLVHDYQLPLVGAHLATARPDLTVVHFSHTPFAGPDAVAMLPDEAAHELLSGLAAHRACGFHAARWADAFTASCDAVLGPGRAPATFVAPAAADVEDIRGVAASPACGAALEALEAEVGDRHLLVRVDRIELSKNLLRGFHAFDDLLQTHPEWRERVVFGAFVYPSREGLAEYQAYRQEVEGLIARINATWATPGWTPILYDPVDDFPRSVAALRRADVLLVNPVRDGLNLVAKEGAIVNERDGVLALSRESGAWAELGGAALEVNPFDVAGTSDVLHRALSMGAAERATHAAAVRELALARTPADWLADQLAAAGA